MKKVIALIVAVVLCISVFAGCGEEEIVSEENLAILLVGAENYIKMTESGMQSESDVQEYKEFLKSIKVTDENRVVAMLVIASFLKALEGEPSLENELNAYNAHFTIAKISLEALVASEFLTDVVDKVDGETSNLSDLLGGDYLSIILNLAGDKATNEALAPLKGKASDSVNDTIQNLLNSIVNDKNLWRKLEKKYPN